MSAGKRNRAPGTATERAVRWLDQRLGAASFARTALDKVFPDHWSFMVGEVALYCFVVLVLTGSYLAFFFRASTETVVYHGAYAPLRGLPMSEAYRSALDLSFSVRAGLVMRQVHHWAALVFLAAIVVHLTRVFLTGAFRRPREVNWMIGVTLLVLAIVNGFAGYSLLDDQLSGTGLRIAYGIALSVPVIGTWITSLVFGGKFPGPDIIGRLYVLHILIIPVAIGTLLTLHLAIVVRHKHTQFAGEEPAGDGAPPGTWIERREDNVVGERLWPTYAAKASGLFFLTAAVLCALGGLAQINPIWLFGPFNPARVSAASQPDWYMGWLDGALRIMPPWEIRAFGFEIPNPFFPGALLAGLTFGALYLWPFIEARVTGDRTEHHLCDRPRQRPARTALGFAALSFYTVLGAADSSDVISSTFNLSVNRVLITFRVAVFVVPVAVGLLTDRLCRGLCARDALACPAPVRLRDLGRGAQARRRPSATKPQTPPATTTSPGTQ